MPELTATSPARSRVNSIDILRGLVMVIMALDHVRDFFHKVETINGGAAATGPTDLATTYPALFFTRWITHFCAPIFVFLAGSSAFLMARKRPKGDLSLFLIKRGIWLVIVELVIITLGWTFNPFFNLLILQVIWAIGVSMIILGVLIWLPLPVLLLIGFVIVFGHNVLDYPDVKARLQGSLFFDLAYYDNFHLYTLAKDHFAMVIYAVIPWTGIMILGYGFGQLFTPGFDPARRRRLLLLSGFSLLALFLLLRIGNFYGDPLPWSAQPRGPMFTFLSFININKYPPSLDYFCVTIGVGLLLLWVLERARNAFTEFFRVYGRVPMFYYILHFYLIHTLVVIFFFLQGYHTSEIVDPKSPFLFRPTDFGIPLWGVYLVWIFVFMTLYPLCKKYDRYKTMNAGKKWWLSYL